MSIRKAIAQKILDGGDGGWMLAFCFMLFTLLALVSICIAAFQIVKEASGC